MNFRILFSFSMTVDKCDILNSIKSIGVQLLIICALIQHELCVSVIKQEKVVQAVVAVVVEVTTWGTAIGRDHRVQWYDQVKPWTNHTQTLSLSNMKSLCQIFIYRLMMMEYVPKSIQSDQHFLFKPFASFINFLQLLCQSNQSWNHHALRRMTIHTKTAPSYALYCEYYECLMSLQNHLLWSRNEVMG